MRKRSIVCGLAAAGMALTLATGPALADDDGRFAEGAAIAVGALAVAQAFLGPPVVVAAPAVVVPPPVVVVPPPPVVVVPPPPVVLYRHGPPTGRAWGYWVRHGRHEHHEVEWDD